ncbi:FAD dependent oxidoreductase [compost metagenome]
MRQDDYDVAVVGGGVAAVFHACALAEQGRKVVIVADSTSLAHELGLSRLPLKDTLELAARYPLMQAWVDLLSTYDGVKVDQFEPVLTQLLVDVFVRERGIDVLFEALPVQLKWHTANNGDNSERLVGVQLVTREGMMLLKCGAVVDCSEKAVLVREFMEIKPVEWRDVHTLWTLTVLQEDVMILPTEYNWTLTDTHYDIRVAPSYWEEELAISVAVSSDQEENRGEIRFAGVLEQLLLELNKQEELHIGPLLHVSERSWTPPSFVLAAEPGGIMKEQEGGWVSTADDSVMGIGCWTEAGAAALRKAALWEKGGTALKLLVEWALEAALSRSALS